MRAHDGEQLKTCEQLGIGVYVAIPDKSKAIAKQGRYTREQFSYDAGQNTYTRPHNQTLTPSGKQQKGGKIFTRYPSKVADCRPCPLANHCLTEKARIKQLYRWEHQAVLDRHKQRMTQNPLIMKQRGARVKHPFGTLKSRAGSPHFLRRGLEKCRGKFSLMTLAYNFIRVIHILDIDKLRDYGVQRSGNGLKTLGIA
jgi:hypothetical protein